MQSYYSCEIDGPGFDPVDSQGWKELCDLHYNNVDIRVKCFYDKSHPDGDYSC